jgi:hypothetical protein
LRGSCDSTDAAPLLGCERPTSLQLGLPTIYETRRLRRRGPRSISALVKRSQGNIRMSPIGDEASGEPEAILPTQICKLQSVIILCINIRSLTNKIIELVHLVKAHDAHLICLQETWLDASHEAIEIPNFICIGRRDRSVNANRGGVAIYARVDIKNVVLLLHSVDAERS